MTLLGNYYGTPARPVTVLAGIRNAAGPAHEGRLRARRRPRRGTAGSARGARRSSRATCGRARAHREQGLRGEYFRGRELQGDAAPDAASTPRSSSAGTAARRRATSWRAARCRPSAALPNDDFSVRWTGQLAAPGLRPLRADGHGRRRLPPRRGRPARDRRVDDDAARPRGDSASVDLEAGKAYDVRLEYFEADPRRRDPAGLAAARRQGAVRGGARRGAGGGRRRLRGRPHRRRRGRGDEGLVPRLRGRRPHRHRAARARRTSCCARCTRPASRSCWC